MFFFFFFFNNEPQIISEICSYENQYVSVISRVILAFKIVSSLYGASGQII